jgi:hypothetical protein
MKEKTYKVLNGIVGAFPILIVIVTFLSINAGRQLNLILSAIAIIVIIIAMKSLWSEIHAARRVLWLGALAYPVSIFYGTLEVLYWPQLTIRIMVSAFGLSMFIVGFTTELRDASK